jgi:hypothetical protein
VTAVTDAPPAAGTVILWRCDLCRRRWSAVAPVTVEEAMAAHKATAHRDRC